MRVEGNPVATGSAARIALTAADRGAAVQLIGKVGDDPDGEALILALAQGHVGHVALLRDPAHRTPVDIEAADPSTRGSPKRTIPRTGGGKGGRRPHCRPGARCRGRRTRPSLPDRVSRGGRGGRPRRGGPAHGGGCRRLEQRHAARTRVDGRPEPAGMPPEAIVLVRPTTMWKVSSIDSSVGWLRRSMRRPTRAPPSAKQSRAPAGSLPRPSRAPGAVAGRRSARR